MKSPFLFTTKKLRRRMECIRPTDKVDACSLHFGLWAPHLQTLKRVDSHVWPGPLLDIDWIQSKITSGCLRGTTTCTKEKEVRETPGLELTEYKRRFEFHVMCGPVDNRSRCNWEIAVTLSSLTSYRQSLIASIPSAARRFKFVRFQNFRFLFVSYVFKI